MVYVYSKKSDLDKYIGKKLSIEKIEEVLIDLGMDVKGISNDKDPELKIELTAEKVDMISTVGISRAIKYYLGLEKKVRRYKIKKGNHKLIVKKNAKESRPKTVAAIIRNIDLNEKLLNEIIEIQEKIHESFGRGRKKGAIGIYPIDKIKFPITYGSEDPKNIKYRALESDREMNGFEILSELSTGRKYAHLLEDYKKFPVFRDASTQVLSMPPIINSYNTGKVEMHHKDLFIECSGYNLRLLNTILTILVTTFIELGGEAESMKVEYEGENFTYELNLDNTFDEIDINYVNRLIGIDISVEDAKVLLNKVMYGVCGVKGDKIKVEIPCYRFDVWHDVDMSDDIARAYGYNNIKLKSPNIVSVGNNLNFSSFKERFSDTLVKMGFLEVYNYILSSTNDQFEKMNLDVTEHIKLIDSSDEGINMCRVMNLPEVLKCLHFNRKNKYPQKVFENGFTIQIDPKKDTGARNENHLTICFADPKSDYSMIKGSIDTLFNLNEIKLNFKKKEFDFLIKGRSACVNFAGEEVGFIGELDPHVLINFGLIVPVSVFEINLEKVFEMMKK